MRMCDRFRHAPNAATVIARSLILPRSPWDAHSLILCSAQSALVALISLASGLWPPPGCKLQTRPRSGRTRQVASVVYGRARGRLCAPVAVRSAVRT